MIFDDNEVHFDNSEGEYYVFFHCVHCGNLMESAMSGLKEFKTVECQECGAWLKYQITVEVAEEVRALNIILKSEGDMYPERFASLMWPDSEGHQRSHKVGRSGSSKGVGMALAAGGFLGRLRTAGLTDWKPAWHGYQRYHFVTEQGERLLENCGGAQWDKT
jgi:transcription elongation factor Elf1